MPSLEPTAASACPSDDDLARLADGDAPPELDAAIHAHAAACPRCYATLAALLRGGEGTESEPSRAPGDLDDTVPSADADDGAFGRRPQVSADGRYVFGEPFGAGGLGVVRLARDRRLRRPVAVKELLRGGAEAERRFLREAVITARLQHPAIVPIYDIGRHPSGEPFYCMKLIDGRTLAEAIRGCEGLGARMELLEHVIAAADAVAYAHRHGVVHRDLKPANVLIGEVGETVVIDWGLAKDLSGAIEEADVAGSTGRFAAVDLTQAGAVMGTLRYMPPEQARGGEIDARSDVFALGALLFHVLAGAPPYAGLEGGELLARVAAGEHEDLRALCPEAPPELVAIAEKAMRPDPAARYPSATDLAEDLRRLRSGRMVAAHRYTAGEVVRRWLRRHRPLVAVAAASLVVLAGVGAVAIQNVRRERDAATAASRIAVDEQRRARAAEAEAREERAEAERQRAAAREQLMTTLGGKASDAVALGSGMEALTIAGEALAIREDAIARGALIAGASGPFERLLWAAPLVERPYSIAWHAGAGVLALEKGRIERFTAAGEALEAIPGGDFGYAFKVSPDGRRIVTSGGGSLLIYEPAVDVRAPTVRLDNPAGPTGAYGFVWRDDDHVVAADLAGDVGLWQISTGTRRSAFRGHREYIRAITGHAGRRLVVSGSHDRTIRAWDPWTSRELGPLEQAGVGAYSVDISPDGAYLAAAGEVRGGDGKIRIWDLRTYALIEVLRGHRGEVPEVRFSPDGRWLASGGRDETLRLWHVPSFTEAALLRSVGGGVPFTAFAPDGSAIAVAFAHDARLRAYALRQGGEVLPPRDFPRPIERVAFSPDGRRIAASRDDGLVHVFERATGASTTIGEAQGQDLVHGHMFWADDASVVVTAADGEFVRVDAASGAVLARAGTPGRIFSAPARATVLIGVSPTPKAPRYYDFAFLRFDAAGPTRAPIECPLFKGLGFVDLPMPWLPGDDAALINAQGRLYRIPLDGSPCAPLSPEGLAIEAVAVDPRGAVIATSTGASLLLHDLPSWAPRATLEERRVTISALRYTRDGRWLIAADWSGWVSVWRTADNSLAARWRAHPNRIWSMDLAPDDRVLATGGADRALRTWDLAGLDLDRDAVGEYVAARTGAAAP